MGSVGKAIGNAVKPVTNVIEKITPWNDKSEGIIPINKVIDFVSPITPWNDKTLAGKIATSALLTAGALYGLDKLAAMNAANTTTAATNAVAQSGNATAGLQGTFAMTEGYGLSGLSGSQITMPSGLELGAGIGGTSAGVGTSAGASGLALGGSTVGANIGSNLTLTGAQPYLTATQVAADSLATATPGMAINNALPTVATNPISALYYKTTGAPYIYDTSGTMLNSLGIAKGAVGGGSSSGGLFSSMWQWAKDNPMIAGGLAAGGLSSVGGILSAKEMAKAQEKAIREQQRQFDLTHNYGGSFGGNAPILKQPQGKIEQIKYDPQQAAEIAMQKMKYDPAYKRGFETMAAKLINPDEAMTILTAAQRYYR